MTQMWLKFVLKSDATFGRGEGVAGLVDAEIEHDHFGLPYLHGRTLKGLLVEECANLLFALSQTQNGGYDHWEQTAQALFGAPGSSLAVTASLRVGDARLPDDLRRQVMAAVEDKKLSRVDVIEMLTDIRRQTAMEATNGRPEDYSLRAMRVVLRETPFWAALTFSEAPDDSALGLLSACIMAFRRAGTGRNRGRGHLTARLLDEDRQDVTAQYFKHFEQEVLVQ